MDRHSIDTQVYAFQVAKTNGRPRTFPLRLRRRATRDSLRCRDRGSIRRARVWGHGRGGLGASFKDDGDLKNCIRAIKIDEISRKMFPFMFGLFNIVYWSYYTQFSR